MALNEVITYPPELLTKKHVAYLLSCSERDVNYLLAQHLLVKVDDGGKWVKIRLTDVRSYIASLKEKESA